VAVFGTTVPAASGKSNWKDAPLMGNMFLATTSSSTKGGFNASYLILIAIVVAGFYLLMIRPQQRRRQMAMQQQSSVQPGARVRTTAGMYATVVDVDGDDVVLEVAPGVEVRYMKRAIMDVVSSGEEPEETEETLADSTEDADDDETPETVSAAGDDWDTVDDNVAESGSSKKD
jgi:preprotein translocase subunit YajC